MKLKWSQLIQQTGKRGNNYGEMSKKNAVHMQWSSDDTQHWVVIWSLTEIHKKLNSSARKSKMLTVGLNFSSQRMNRVGFT